MEVLKMAEYIKRTKELVLSMVTSNEDWLD